MDPQIPPAPSPGGPAPPAPPLPPLPFEDPGRGFFQGLWESVVMLVTHPDEAFRRVRDGDSVGRPLVYAIVMAYVGFAAGLLWFALQAVPAAMLGALAERAGEAGPGGMLAGVSLLVIALGGLLAIPLLTAIWLALATLVVHLFLLLFGGAKRGLVATFRVLAYASTAQLAAIVPFCGGILQAIWALVLDVIGLSRVHETTELRAAAALLAPLVACCLCFVAAMAFGVMAPLLAHAGGQ